MVTRTRRRRSCTYCPKPDADVCVRVLRDDSGGQHIYAHRACAQARNVPPMYSFTQEPTRPGVGA
ncbi:hypothetical protein ACH44C_11035 [Streptomyces purpureus]|uniref:hypothetical protein n=1 Tax=Streptomyces purpureus TaxID=1951 RepID=UPI003793D5A9